MLEVIEKLLILQDRDRNIIRVKDELTRIPPQRQQLETKASIAKKGFEDARLQMKKMESDRKNLELEVDAKKLQIEKYALQQYQTKKNDEYRALNHEIEMAKKAIFEIENKEIDLMEQAERKQKEIAQFATLSNAAQQLADEQLAKLNACEENLCKELAGLESNRGELAAAIAPVALARYERLLKSKGENVVVGVEHGVCGGCHMRLSRQIVVHCQAQQETVACPNCGRILYYSSEMDVSVVD
jgi:uncharacterized protein